MKGSLEICLSPLPKNKLAPRGLRNVYAKRHTSNSTVCHACSNLFLTFPYLSFPFIYLPFLIRTLSIILVYASFPSFYRMFFTPSHYNVKKADLLPTLRDHTGWNLIISLYISSNSKPCTFSSVSTLLSYV